MADTQTIEIPVAGMDCAECTRHVQHAIAGLPGVESVDVYLTSEKAVVRLDPALVQIPAIRKAVADAGYSVPEATEASTAPAAPSTAPFARRAARLLALLFGLVLLVIVVGEWLGLFTRLTERVPFLLGLAIVVAAGWPMFRNVVRAALKRKVTSHTLMTLGVLAALAVGQ